MTLPKAFVEEIESYGADCLSGLVRTLSTSSPETSIRVNRRKGAEMPDGVDRVPWCGDGFYLAERPQFTFDPALHQGLYYVQDASSMAISHAIKEITSDMRPVRYLDACAAPGGKTTAAIASLPPGSLVTANEYDYKRAAILAENLAKWGSPDVVVTRGDTAHFSRLHECFDIIAADVPCSGEGMMRKDAEAVAQWSPALVAECVGRQREIVGNLWEALRPGGYLIYSTCTFNRHENEETVDYICDTLGGRSVDVGLLGFEGVARAIGSSNVCYRFIPGRIRGEGLFMSVIRKDGDRQASQPKTAKKPLTVLTKAGKEISPSERWLDGDFRTVMLTGRVFALPAEHARWMTDASSSLDVISAGVCVASVKGRDFIPAQELALSAALRRDTFPRCEVDYPTALSYLRRESITVDSPRGFLLLTYRGLPLGFVKNLGNRANNLYPSSWRVLSQNAPDAVPDIIKSL